MGHFWSKKSTRKDTSEVEIIGRRTRTDRDERVEEDTDTSCHENQAAATTNICSHLPTRNEGSGALLNEVTSVLTMDHARRLATFFDFKPAQTERIEQSSDPGYVFVNLAREKGIISPTNISAVIDALIRCDLRGVATVVEDSYRRQHDTTSSNITDGYDVKSVFLKELKKMYQKLYHTVQPISYIRDKLFCVDKVFVESGIEYFVVIDKKTEKGIWKTLNSYKDIFKDDDQKSMRRVLEGEPGFGKSTFTLQVAFDWCNGVANSVSDKHEILILLRLKQLRGVKSIYKAIKQFILPKDSSLSENDIKQILKKSGSVLVILDGFDEYPDRDNEQTSDVKSIIRMDMFQEFVVVLTTRTACLPKDLAPQTERFRLTGFDESVQDDYIRKAVVGDDDQAAMTIKRQLRENPILANLCQVPLFFAMFAHMSHESKDLVTFNSVTRFFCYVISCFHHHMRNKSKDENVQKYPLFFKDHDELDRVAFEGLRGMDQQLIWEKESLSKRLGEDFYDYHVRLGIMVEEEVLDVTFPSNAPLTPDFIQEKTQVRFYHKLFCEWYAAHFVSNYAAMVDVRYMGTNNIVKFYHKLRGRKDISGFLEELDLHDLQYVFRFACGLNPDASSKIIKYLTNKKDSRHFAVLCILENEGNTRILGPVRELCSNTVSINYNDTLLLQWSKIHLLEVATVNDISISYVQLVNCYSKVDLSGGNHLQLESKISLPVLPTLKELTIGTERGRKVTEQEFTGILHYSSKCLALKKLEFWWPFLPQYVQDESVSILRARNVKVIWISLTNKGYQLNLHSCKWEHMDILSTGVLVAMTNQEYYQCKVRELRGDDDSSDSSDPSDSSD